MHFIRPFVTVTMLFLPVKIDGSIVFGFIDIDELLWGEILQHAIFKNLDERTLATLTSTGTQSKLKAMTRCYHSKVKNATNWSQTASLGDEPLRPLQGADITSGHEDLDAHGLPLTNTLGLISCQNACCQSVLA